MRLLLVLMFLGSPLLVMGQEKSITEQMAIPVVQEAAPLPPPAPVVESNGIIKALKAADDKIPLGVSGLLLMGLTLAIELLMRFVPSSQPRSVLLLLALGMNLIASILTKSSSLLDKVAQNLKPDKK